MRPARGAPNSLLTNRLLIFYIIDYFNDRSSPFVQLVCSDTMVVPVESSPGFIIIITFCEWNVCECNLCGSVITSQFWFDEWGVACGRGGFNTGHLYFLEGFELSLWLYFNPEPMNAIEIQKFCGVYIGFVWSNEPLLLESLWVFWLCNLFFVKESKRSWIVILNGVSSKCESYMFFHITFISMYIWDHSLTSSLSNFLLVFGYAILYGFVLFLLLLECFHNFLHELLPLHNWLRHVGNWYWIIKNKKL